MRLKKITIFLVIITLTTQLFAFAEPSDWATDLVESSESLNLVPATLKAEYQKPITRAEYVLLALEVMAEYNIDVETIYAKPFTDIESHVNEEAIIKAFNAGIISGYEDQTFRPDKNIRREEITALVYNLVKKINPAVNLPTNYSSYSDTQSITGWALPFVSFNYQNSIMSGVGKVGNLDTINPQGTASREQAIVLLYKLFENKTLLNKNFGAVNITNGDMTNTSNGFNNFVNHVNYNLGSTIYTIQSTDKAAISMIDDAYISLDYADGIITVQNLDGRFELNLVSNTLSGNIYDDYKTMVSSYYDDSIAVLINKQVDMLMNDQTYRYDDYISNKLSINIFYDEESKNYAIHIDDTNE